jgi:hypothetical protein
MLQVSRKWGWIRIGSNSMDNKPLLEIRQYHDTANPKLKWYTISILVGAPFSMTYCTYD